MKISRARNALRRPRIKVLATLLAAAAAVLSIGFGVQGTLLPQPAPAVTVTTGFVNAFSSRASRRGAASGCFPYLQYCQGFMAKSACIPKKALHPLMWFRTGKRGIILIKGTRTAAAAWESGKERSMVSNYMQGQGYAQWGQWGQAPAEYRQAQVLWQTRQAGYDCQGQQSWYTQQLQQPRSEQQSWNVQQPQQTWCIC